MNFGFKDIKINTQERDRDRIKRLTSLSLSKLDILRAGIRAWEIRKQLQPFRKE